MASYHLLSLFPLQWMMHCRPLSNPTAAFETSAGSFTVEIFLDWMPLTASNFIQLAKPGFSDSLHFHRVILDFCGSILMPPFPQCQEAEEGRHW